jgi:hypothetical protein
VTPRRSRAVGFSTAWELLEVRHALASDVDFVGLVAPPDAGSTSTFQQSPASTTIVSPFAVQAASAQTVNSVVVGGLQFQGTFTSQGGVYSTSSVVDVGFAPGSGTFKSLLQLNGSVSIDSNQGLFSASGSIAAVASGSAVTLLSGGITNANISALTSTGLPGLSGANVTVKGLSFTLNSLSLLNTNNLPTVRLQGAVSLYGMSIAVNGANYVQINSNGIDLTGVTATVGSGPLQLGGMTLGSSQMVVSYVTSTQTLSVAGTSSATVSGLGTINVGLGSGTTQGLVVTNGAFVGFAATVGINTQIAGGTFTSSSTMTYSNVANTFTVTGSATEVFGTGDSAKTLALTLGSEADVANNIPATAGLVIKNNKLDSLNAKAIASNWTIAGGTFNATGLVTYAAASGGNPETLTLTGNASEVFGTGSSAKTLALTLGSEADVANGIPATTGLVIKGNNLDSLNAKGVASNWTIAGGKFNATALVTYAAASGGTPETLTVTGNASEVFGTGSSAKTLALSLGSAAVPATGTAVAIPATKGLVIQNNSLSSLNARATASNWSIAGTTLSFDALVNYASANDQLGVQGSATFTQSSLGTLNVQMGTMPAGSDAGVVGLVLSGGQVSSLDMTLNSNITTGGLTFNTTGLNFVYAAQSSTFTLTGASSFSFNSQNVGVTFGGSDSYFGSAPTAGLVITNGNLSSVDMIVTSSISVGSLSFRADHLRFTRNLQNSNNVFTMTGATGFSAGGLGSVSATFGTAAANGNPATTGLVVTNGSLTSLDMSLTSNISVASVGFSTNGLRFTYQSSANQFTLGGSASATVGGIGNMDVIFGYTDGGVTSPGLVVKNGSLVNLDMTVNSSISVGQVGFDTTGLRFTYTQSTQTYTLGGSAGISVGGTSGLRATFGYTNPDGSAVAGLTIVGGNVVSLCLTVNSSFAVGGVSFGARDLNFTYQNLSQIPGGSYSGTGVYTGPYSGTYSASQYQFNMAGTAFVTIGGMSNLSVAMGNSNTVDGVTTTTPGLIIVNGKLEALDLTVNAGFAVGEVQFGVEDLQFTYQNTSQIPTGATRTTGVVYAGPYDTTKSYDTSRFEFCMSGTGYVTVGGTAGLSVTFGYTNTATGEKTPGLILVNGNLEAIDVAINANFTVGDVAFGVDDLRFTYQNMSQIPAGTNYIAGTVYTGVYDTGRSYNAANFQFSMAGTAFVAIGGTAGLSVTFGHTNEVTGFVTPGVVIRNGNLESLDVTVNANFEVGKLVFAVDDLKFTYQNMSQLPQGYNYIAGTVFTGTYDTSRQYNGNNFTFSMSGSASVAIGSTINLGVTFGDSETVNGELIVTPGMILRNGNLQSIDATVNAAFTVYGVTFGADDLRFVYQNRSQLPAGTSYEAGTVYTESYDLSRPYNANNYTFGMSGSVFVTVGEALTMTGTFGRTEKDGSVTPGLVISDGEFVSLDVTVRAPFAVGGRSFADALLNFSVTAATQTFTLTGLARVSLFEGMASASVSLGKVADDGTILENGIVIVGGQLRSLDFTINSDWSIGLSKFTIQDMRVHYSQLAETVRGVSYPARTFTMGGTASMTTALLSNVDVEFGGDGTEGLVVTNGQLINLDMSVNSSTLSFGGYALANRRLELAYSRAAGTFTMTGESSINLPEVAQLEVTLGGNGTAGLVINTQNNVVVSFNMAVTSDFSIAGMKFAQSSLVMNYADATRQFTIVGDAKLNLGIATFTATLGGTLNNGITSQGLVVRNGRLISLDATVDAGMGVPGLELGSARLYVGYDALTRTFDFTGTGDATLDAKLPGWVTNYFGIPSGSWNIGSIKAAIHVEQGGSDSSPLPRSPVSAGSGAADPNADLPWTFGIGTGMTTPVEPNALPPVGDRVKYLTGKGSITSLSRNFLAGNSYSITFAAAQQAGNTANQSIVVTIDGQSIGVFTPKNTEYQSFTTSTFNPGPGNRTIAFSGLGDGVTAYVSNVSVNGAADQATLTTPLSNPTPFNSALSFNGTSDFVQLPSAGFTNFTNGFSAGMWAYTSSVADSSKYFSFGNGPNSDNIVLRRDGTSNNLRFAVLRGSSSQGITAPDVIQLNTWQYLSVTVTPAGVATIYVNGVAVATDTNPGFVPNVVDRATNYLARSPWGNALFQGQMNSLSVWNRPLSATEVQAAQSTVYNGTEAGLVGYWGMNDTTNGVVFDRGPNSLNSDPGPNPTSFSSALSFNGTSDFAQLPSNGLANFTNGFSAGIWAYTSSVAPWSRYLDFGNGPLNDNILLTRVSNTNDLSFTVYRGGSAMGITAPNVIQLDTWQHFSVTVTPSGTATIYVNGVAVATNTSPSFLPNNVTRVNNYIGKSNWAADALFEGKLNSLSVWNRALSAAEVQAAPSTAYTGSESGLVGFWRLNDVANGTFIDRSPSARNGTTTGSTVAISSPAIATSENKYVTAGRAMTFDGVNDFVNLPSAGLNDFSQGYTIGFWANTSSVAAWSRYLDFGNGPLNDNILLTRVFNTNDLSFTVYRGGSAMGVTAPNVIQLNTWQHFSVTVTPSGTATIYVNGVAVATSTSPSFLPNNVTRVNNYIGKSNWAADALFKGQMRDLSIWKTALTPAQVAASMTTLDTGNASSPSGYWPLSSFAPLNGTTTGSTVTINSQAIVSGQPSYVTAGSAMTFDGVSTSVQLPSAGFRDFSQGFSAGVWAYTSSVANWGRYFEFGNGVNSDNIVLSRNFTTNDLTFFVAKGSSIVELTATNAIQLNTWQYFSVTVTPSGVATLYVNGNVVASTTNMGLVPNVVNRANAYIGKSNFPSDALFQGQMSSLSVWNTALTPAQVTAGMTTSYTGNENNLVGFWPLSGPANTPTRTTTLDNTFTNAQSFNGSSTFVTATPNSSTPNFADLTTGFSASLWAYTSAVGNYARYFDFGNPGGGGDNVVLTREGTTNNLRLEVWKNGGVTALNATGAIKLNTWQHFSVTVTSSGVATLFVNGNSVATSTSPGFIPSAVNRPSSLLGKSNNPNDALFQGQMSNFSFWKTALTPAQVQAASNAVLGGSEANLAYYDSLGFIPQSVTPNITTPAALPYSTATAQGFNETFVNAQGFNGSSTFVNAALTASSPGVANLTNGFSAGLWAYTSAVGNFARYFDIGNAGGGGENVVLTRDGTSNNLRLEVWKNGSVQALNATGVIQLNTWQHFSVTVNSSGVATIYVNGAQVATSTSQGFVPNNVARSNTYIGKSNNPVDALFQGQMSNFSFWNRPLTPAEIQATSYTNYVGSEANLVSYNAMGFSPPPATSAAQVIASANSAISIPGNNLTDFSQGFSAGVWAYTSSVATWARYFDFGNGAVSDNILLTRTGASNDLSFTVFRGGSSQSVTATNVIQLNTWQYFSVSVTPSGVATLFVNGNAVASATNAGLVPNVVARASNFIGKSNWSGDALFQGKMMGLSVWNKPLTPAQMSSNANLATPQPTGNEPNLVVFVPMDGSPAATVLDRSPRQLNGIPQGGIAYAPTGSRYNTAYAGSLTFNGTSTFVTLPGTGFRDFSQGFSAGMWAYTTSVADGSKYFSFGNGPNSDNIVLRRDATSNNLRFAVLRGSSSQGITAPNVIQLNTWQYLSVTVTPAGVATIYVNGVAVATDTNPGFVPNVVDRATNYLAKSPWGNALFQGQMSSVSVWNTPLSQAQIQAGMSTAYSGTETGLVCFLPMNETNGSTVDDRSPNRNDGTVNGGIISQTTYTGNNLDNLDFQAITIAPGTTVAAPANTAWTYTGSAGITSNTGTLAAPLGTQVATLPGTSSMSTTLTGFAPNQTYSVSFQAAQPAGSNQSVEVLLDGQSLGTYIPPAAVNTSGTPLQSALSFDGRTSYVSLPSSGMSDFTGGGFTASVWAKTSALGNYSRYFDFGDAPFMDSIVLTREGTTNNLRLEVWKNGVVTGLNAPGAIQFDTWQYFSVTIDGNGGARIFVNGTQVNYSVNTGFIPRVVNRPNCFLGKSTNSTNDALFQGQMGDLSVWKVALWPSEVMTGYTTGYTGNEPNLVGLWRLGDANTTSQGLGASSGAKAYGNFVPGSVSTAGLAFNHPKYFNGTTDFVTLPSTGLGNFDNGFSAGIWVYPTNNANYQKFFNFGNGYSSNNITLGRYRENNDLIFTVHRGSSIKDRKTYGVITPNTWQYFSVTITPSGVTTIYKNGVQIDQDTSSNWRPLNVERYTNYAGQTSFTENQLFQGQMADLGVWNRAISAEEVQSAYTSGLRGDENGLVQLNRLGEVKPVISTTDALPMQRPMNFDGSSNYVILPSTGLNNFTSGFSASVWAYTSSTANWAKYFDFGNGAASDNILLTRVGRTNDLAFTVFRGGSSQTVTAPNAITLNSWQYFSVSVNSAGVANLYVNGNLVASNTNANFVPNNLSRAYNFVGLSNWTGDAIFKGQMGDLSIWNKPLSADEIRTGYTSGFQGTEQGLVGLWRLGDLGSTVPDSGPNGYDGGANGNTNSLQFTPGYQLFTLPVVMPGAGTRTLTFRGTNSNGGANAFISNIAFTTSPVFVPPSAITYAPPALRNTSFENTDWTGWSSQGSGFAYNPTGVSMGWSFSGNAGVTQHGYGLDTSYSVNGQDQGNGDSPPDGNWGAFLQSGYGTNGSMSQTVSGFVAGQSYDISLFAKARNSGVSGNNDVNYRYGFRSSFTVYMDGVALGTYQVASSTNWQQISIPGIIPGPGDHTFTITTNGALPLYKNGNWVTTNPNGSNPDLVALIDQVQFLNSGADTVAAVIQSPSSPSPSNGVRNSYSAFTVNVSGVDIGMQVFFDGKVNLIFGDVLGLNFQQLAQDLTKSYKATATALAGAYNQTAAGLQSGATVVAHSLETAQTEVSAAADRAASQATSAAASAATSVARNLVKDLNRVRRRLRRFFNYSVSDATIYYDSTRTFNQTPAYTAKSDAAGGFQQLQLPEQLTGQLVGYGGINTATGLANDAIFTAVAKSDVVSALTTLVNRLVVQGYPDAEAIAIVGNAFGIPATPGDPNVPDSFPTPYDINAAGTLASAMAGDRASSLAFAAEVKTYLVAHEMAALLMGLPGRPAGLAISDVMTNAFGALTDLFIATTGTVSLGDPAVIESLIQATATASGLTIDSLLSTPAAGIIARVVGGIEALEAQDPTASSAPGTQSFLQRVAAFQTLANGVIAQKLTQAAGLAADAPNGIDSLAANYSSAQLASDAAATIIGNLLAPELSVANATGSTGAGQSNFLTFAVLVSGESSPLLPLSVNYTTADGTATAADGDYTPVSGTLTWDPGDTAPKFIQVPIGPGTAIEAANQFTMQLSSPTNAILRFTAGVGMIETTVFGTTTTLSISATTATAFTPVEATVTVTNQDGTNSPAAGTVSFYEGDVLLGMRTLDATGTVTVGTAQPLVGDHFIHVVYNGNTIPGAKYTPSTSNTVNINVTKASQSIAFDQIGDTIYGASPIPLAATSSFGLPVSFSVISGPATITDGSLVITGAGTVVVRATQIGDDNIDPADPVDVTFTVAKATLTVVVDDQRMVYGAARPTLTYAIGGFVGDDSASSLATSPTLSTVAAHTAVGTYDITAAGLADPNYTAVYVPAQLTITPATLTVTVDPKTMVYGGTMPTLTYSMAGLVGPDTASTLFESPVLATTAATSSVGTYPISIAVSDPNYSIVVVPAELTITQAALKITADSFTIVRNQALPTFTAKYQGLVNGDTEASLPQQALVTRNSSSNDAGSYTLTPSDSVAPNYAITYEAGTLTITKTQLTLSVNSANWYPGLGAAQFSGTYAGFFEGEDASSLTSQPTFAVTGPNASFFNSLIAAGPAEALALLKANPSFGNLTFPLSVPVGARNVTSKNYDITVVPGTLTFTAAKSVTFLTASNTNAVRGDSVTFTAMTQVYVEVQDPGTQQTRAFGFIPASTVGTVQFKVDGVNVGTPKAVNAAGEASFTSSTLSTGSHTITAVFSSGLGKAIGGNTQTLQIDTLNAAPTATNLSKPETYTEDTPLNLTDIVVSDVDSATVTATLTLSIPAAGSLNTSTFGAVTSTYDVVTGVWSASGAIANVNTLLAALTFTPAPNFNGTFTIGTSVTDGNLWVSGSKTMTGVAVNDAPTGIALSATTVAENASVGTAVGTLSTTDADAGDTFTYTLVSGPGSADNASFTIDGSTLKTAASLNFEGKNSYAVRVRTTDAGGRTTDKKFTITVTNVNEAPIGIALSATRITENAAAGTTVGTLSTTDVDAGNTFTYTLVSGAGSDDNASFTIVGNTLRTAATFNFEAKNSYSVRISTTDAGGLTTEKQFTITVTNVNERPTNITLSATSVAENAAVGTAVGTLSTTDVDAGDTFTYTLVSGPGSNDNASFTIDGSTLKTAASFNFEGKSSYAVRVRTTDAGGRTTDKKFTITVTNVNEAPIVSAPVSFTVTEDVKGNLVWPVSSTPFADVDSASLTVTLAVADGTISAASTAAVAVGGTATARTFTGTPAALNAYFKTAGAIGYTTAKDNTVARTLTTTVSDGSLSTQALSTINITPVNDAPTLNPAATLGGGRVGTAYEITYDVLRAALNVADVDTASPSIVITAIDAGTVQKWSGTAWVAVSTSPRVPLAQRLLSAGEKIRWVPPAGVSGNRAAFKANARDGVLNSTVTAQVTINLAPA